MEPEKTQPVRPAEWFWEGSVQARIAEWLVLQGWEVLQLADTKSHQPGVDIVATQGNRRLAVEVKGWPSRYYATGPRAGERMTTHPTIQARHWFSHALLTALQLRQ